MEIGFEVASTAQHFQQILQLQRQNLFSAISAEQQAEQGFVFAEHTISLLEMMAAHLPQVMAVSNDKVVGYNLAMPISMKNEVPSLVPMFREFERCEYQGRSLMTYSFVVGGQVCVHKNFRGKGLLRRLYHETRNRLPHRYQLCVTEVSARNCISLGAHKKMGFEVISTYHDGADLWNLVIWDLRNSGDDFPLARQLDLLSREVRLRLGIERLRGDIDLAGPSDGTVVHPRQAEKAGVAQTLEDRIA